MKPQEVNTNMAYFDEKLCQIIMEEEDEEVQELIKEDIKKIL